MKAHHLQLLLAVLIVNLQNLEPQVIKVHKHTAGLIARNKEIANGLFEFGLAFSLLGQSEADGLGTALTTMGRTADHLSLLAQDCATAEQKRFEQPLQDYVRIIGAVKEAMAQRVDRMNRFELAISEMQSKKASLDYMKANNAGNASGIARLEQELAAADVRVETTKLEYEQVSQRVLKEVEVS